MCAYAVVMIRWSWAQTPKGNWVCQSGRYVAVAEWRRGYWEIRLKTDQDTMSSMTLTANVAG